MRPSLFAAFLAFCGPIFAQAVEDYPVAEFEFPRHRLVWAPFKLVGGMDPTKRDEGVKVDLIWTPSVFLQALRYEWIPGNTGTYGFGPIAHIYLGQDSVKSNAFALGAFSRIYSGLGTGSYIQFDVEWFQASGAKVLGGTRPDSVGKIITNAVTTSGPQVSPILGYNWLIKRHWALDLQMGFTVGSYTTNVSGGPVALRVGSETLRYKSGTDWGGFYFAQVGLGYAW